MCYTECSNGNLTHTHGTVKGPAIPSIVYITKTITVVLISP